MEGGGERGTSQTFFLQEIIKYFEPMDRAGLPVVPSAEPSGSGNSQ
jgi:hypothetical protein